MSLLTMLYQIVIGPLELFFESLYSIAYSYIWDYGLTIIVLSIVMNLLVLPLYRRADEMQEEERKTEARLHKGITHIKKTFKGDEKMLMLQTYYRQNNYKTSDVIKGSVSLLLEIPFFIAAYNFLSGLASLQGVSLGPIADLGKPDALLDIAGVHINVLPIIMTAINLVSGAIYTKGSTLKSKIQLYIMAAVFLIFLYSSPAGLVFYWTLNNLFSLIKNIFYKLKNPKKILLAMASLCGIVFIGIGLKQVLDTVDKNVILMELGLLLQLPVLFVCLKGRGSFTKKEIVPSRSFFIIGGLFAAVFIGLLIPSTYIKASPFEYVDFGNFFNPIWFVVSAVCLAIGCFMVWFGVFYWLMNDSGKALFERILFGLDVMFVINYMFFGNKLGIISYTLKYEEGMPFGVLEKLVNILVVIAIFVISGVALYYFSDKVRNKAKGILVAATFAVVGMSAYNIYGTQSMVLRGMETHQEDEINPHFTLSKTGKNVVVIMLDRAMGPYIPYIMNDKPELKEQYAGFTYYSNVSSFGGHTNIATPALYGGYEYTPYEINKRSDERLVDKQNEALKVMPVIFDQNDYDVMVCNPTYANYQWIPDLSIYDDYPEIKATVTSSKVKADSLKRNIRNFFCFSLMKSMPVVSQHTIYNYGKYNATERLDEEFICEIQSCTGISHGIGIKATFMDAYTNLKKLPNITSIDDKKNGSFIMYANDVPHEPMILQEPDYTPQKIVDNSKYVADYPERYTLDGVTLKMKTEGQVGSYHANMAAMLILGKWFDYLRANDVYDNTKIILVSDHGFAAGQLKAFEMGTDYLQDGERYTPLLMVKDYDAKEYTVSDEFMTNADVPVLATRGVVTNPVNPFTGKAITNEEKHLHNQYILGSTIWDVNSNKGKTFLPGMWLSVHDNIWDKSNWEVEQKNSISPLEEITP